MLHNEVRCNIYGECRSAAGHTQPWASHNHGLCSFTQCEGSAGVFGVSNCYRKRRKQQLPLLPYTKNGFNEQLHVPSGDPCCHESCSISVPFHPALLLQT